jgi:Yip1 domain
MMDRIMKAIMFKTEVYPEVSKDETFTQSAWIIVAVVALISQIGGRAYLIRSNFLGYLLGVIIGAAVMVGAFALSVFVIRWLASALFKVELTFGELQRPLGLAYVFQVIQILSILGAFSVFLLCLTGPITLLAAIAGFIAYLFALKTVTNLDWGKVAVLVVVAWLIFLVVGAIVGAIFAVPAALSAL